MLLKFLDEVVIVPWALLAGMYAWRAGDRGFAYCAHVTAGPLFLIAVGKAFFLGG